MAKGILVALCWTMVVRHRVAIGFGPAKIGADSGFNLKDACTLHRWYLDSYKGQMADDSTLKLSMNTNSAYVGLTHPMNPVDGGGGGVLHHLHLLFFFLLKKKLELNNFKNQRLKIEWVSLKPFFVHFSIQLMGLK